MDIDDHATTKHVKLVVEGTTINITPSAFSIWANQFFQCWENLSNKEQFSPVPYFLLCRSIELELKSIHLENHDKSYIKSKLGHNLVESYRQLPEKVKILTQHEENILSDISNLYTDKRFEYFSIEDAVVGYSLWPDIVILSNIASKILKCRK